MNRIYNVIWSKAKNCYVVVSELVKSGGGKASVNSARTSITFRAALCAFAITGCLVSGIAEANVVQGPGAAATGSNSVAVGDNAKSAGAKSVAVGNDATTLATSENGIAIGNGAKAEGQQRVKVPYPAGTIAIGQGSVAKENGDIVIGRQAKSTISKYHQQPGSGAVVMGAEAASYGSRGDVVIGAAAEANIIRRNATADGDGQLFSQSVAIGSVAKVYGTQSVAIGGDVRSIGQSSIAIGGDDIDQAKPDLYKAIPDLAVPGTQKNFNREVAALHPGGLGTAALNDSKNYVNTASIGNASLAIGMMTQSLGTGSNAIGANSLSKGVASTAIGAMARSWGNNSLAIGSQAGAYGEKSTALGDTNTVGFDMTNAALSGASAGALGKGNKVYGNNAYAIGSDNTVGTATVTETTEANGDKIKKVTAGTVKGNTAGAFGYKNTITTDNSYAVGSNSTISGDNGMVLGNSATVTGANGLALGNNTKVANDNAVAIGNGSETAAAVATSSATINGATHNFAGTNPASTVSVGKAGMERTVTNVAAGRISATSTDAINGSQLFAVKTEVEKGVSYAGDVKAAGAADNKFTRKLGEQTNVVGGVTDATKLTDNNIGVVSNGTDTLNIKLAKTLTGLDSVTAGGTTINNGGLTVDGKNYVSPNGINANDQKITNVANGDVAANSKDAVNGGQLHQVKQDLGDQITNTKNDLNNKIDNTKTDLINKGLRFNADNDDEKTNKLGSKVTVNGDDNITTEITQTGDDTKIALKLKKDLNVRSVTATDTVKAGDVTMGKQADGANPGNTGNYITGLDNKNWDPGNVVSGRAATEDQLKQALANQTATGLKFDANVGGVQTSKLGSTVIVQGEGKAADADYSGENIKTFIKQDAATGNTTIDVKMSKNLKAESVKVGKGDNKDGVSITGPDGANGTDGKVGITGKDGKDAVSMSGKDGIGHIGLNGKDGRSADITAEKGDPDIEGNAITRIKYQDENGKTHQVATKDDGMKYGGDSGAVINKKLNEQVNVIGGITDAGKLTTEDNLGVVSDGSNNLKVRMAKDLKGLETVTTKDAAGNTTVVNGGGMKITPASGNPVSLTKDGLDNGGNKITNVAKGTAPTDAVNKSQLDQAAAAATTTVTAGDNIKVTPSDNPNGSKNYEVSLKDQVTLGSDPKKQIAIDGNAGTIKAGDKVEIDGNKGTIKVGKDGQDGVSITGPDAANGTDGKVGIAGKDGKDAVSMSGKDGIGHIGLNGKDGRSADITAEKGDPNLDGNEITRIKYQDENGKTHQVATKDDGMKYSGDSGAVINKKLNEQVNVIGGITDAGKLTSEDNLGVVSDGSNNLKVRMAKDLKGLETVTTKDAAGNSTVVNGSGMTITPASGNAVSLTKDGLDNGGNKITNVAAGVNGTDAVNVNQLKGATDKMANAINAVAGETQRVGAHAAAMSALKPIQYDPLEPTQVMAGIGNYRGETAAALGVAHYTAEDTMFHVGVSVGSHHNMVNAGVTHKFGNSDAKKAIPERYKGGPISSVYVLQDEVTALKAENARMQESLNELSSVKEDNEQMKAQIALLMQQAGLTK